MEKNKRNKIIGIILIVTIVLLIIILGIWGYNILKGPENNNTEEQNSESGMLTGKETKATGDGNSTLSTIQTDTYTKEKRYMEDYEIVGELEIPKIDLKTNILAETTKRALEIAVTVQYPPGAKPNQPGNIVIYGHNYRNSLFFSRNDELEIGDKFYITDEEGVKKTYIIYSKFETNATDTSFYTKTAEQTGGKSEVTLSTCTDDASQTEKKNYSNRKRIRKLKKNK